MAAKKKTSYNKKPSTAKKTNCKSKPTGKKPAGMAKPKKRIIEIY